MDLPVNQFKQAIKSGKTQIGIWSSLHYALPPLRRAETFTLEEWALLVNALVC